MCRGATWLAAGVLSHPPAPTFKTLTVIAVDWSGRGFLQESPVLSDAWQGFCASVCFLFWGLTNETKCHEGFRLCLLAALLCLEQETRIPKQERMRKATAVMSAVVDPSIFLLQVSFNVRFQVPKIPTV